MARQKLNSLQQEILLQEQLTVANEINKLEFDIANGVVNIARNNRYRFWVSFFSILTFIIFAIYVMIIMLIPDLVNITNVDTQRQLIIGCSIILLIVPIFNILYLTASSLRIKSKNALQKRVNQAMLTRLLDYYKLLKFEFDPERYKVYDDSFVVDLDENGNLIKYVRFYNEDGSITTRPFKDTQELRKFIDEAEEQRRLKLENDALMRKVMKLDELNNNFNNFDLIENNAPSRFIVEESNIGTTKLVRENIDFYPDQYEDKVFKWFNKEEFREAADFRDRLRGNILQNSWDNGESVVCDASWLKEELGDERKKNRSLFFKHYDLQKQLAQTSDVVSFINLIKNFDLAKNPEIDWVNTIDPKDIGQTKLKKYNELMKEYEERALALTNEQIRLETILKNDNSKVLKVQLVDSVGVDTYEKFDPYKNIRKELDKQERRVEEIKKAKDLFKEFGLEETNFEGLTIKEIKHLTNAKIKEAKKLKQLSNEENVDQLVKLNNEIARIKDEKFKEIHLANEKYENEEGKWEYHDGAGNYFELNENNEWVPTEHAAVKFENNKENRVAKAQQKYYDDQRKKMEQEKLEMEQKVRELEELNNLKEEKQYKKKKSKEDRQKAKELAKQAKEKEKQLVKESLESEKISTEEYQSQFDEKEKYIEVHPANEPFVGPDGKWVYHDGQGNYFSTDEYNQWIPIEPLVKEVNPFEVIDEKEKKKILKKQMKELKQHQEEIEEAAKKQAEEANQQPAQEATATEQQQSSVTVNEDGSQQWQDENGTWWYLDAQGNYYYSDGTDWVPWQG